MISLNNFHNMESSIEITSGHSVVSPRQLLDYSFECKSLARVTRKLHRKYFSLIFATLQSTPPDENHYPLQHRLIGNHWGNSAVKMSCNKCSQLLDAADGFFDFILISVMNSWTLEWVSACSGKTRKNSRVSGAMTQTS